MDAKTNNGQRMFAQEPVLHKVKAGKTVIFMVRGRSAVDKGARPAR